MRRGNAFLAVASAFALTVAVATPSSALGDRTEPCSIDGSYYGSSTTSGGAYTTQTVAGLCGNVGARVRYEPHPGSALYWSAWSYGSKSVTRSPQTRMIGGGHRVTNGGLAFTNTSNT
jgi:hypothetical protein